VQRGFDTATYGQTNLPGARTVCAVIVLQIKTTSPDAYQVTPHRGLIDPGDVANVVIKYILGTAAHSPVAKSYLYDTVLVL